MGCVTHLTADRHGDDLMESEVFVGRLQVWMGAVRARLGHPGLAGQPPVLLLLLEGLQRAGSGGCGNQLERCR